MPKGLRTMESFVLRGPMEGPTVMLTAGVHGTEIAGTLAAAQLRRWNLARGTLVVVPIVNRRAYRLRTRGNPDINRTFPRKRGARARHSISRTVFAIAEKYRPHWCIDLHEANGFYRRDHTKLGQTLIVYPNARTLRTARQVVKIVNTQVKEPKKKFSVRQGVLPGSFRTAAGRLLKAHAVTVETSMQQPLRARVEYQTLVVEVLLRDIGLLE